ncbi:RDD family protein [Psychromonas antarctica]|jgi:uncharacterized RDD family membrane protein YckC|uniref:RDD family protein n=1 Tax=Psychromonas antarctica TaxID=67573 RepID=UPI001EE9492C|nr:RDD family protein [Psychromonas antarctica]MCG6201933.1 RDD family protein [Psychromonas antarctica]
MAKIQHEKAIPLLQAQYQSCPRANFINRLGAYIYDLIVISALLMLATILAVLVVIIGNKVGLINLSLYRDVADYLANNLLFAGYLSIVIMAFYGYFWTQSGQTIGMKAWRLRVQNTDGSNITITQSLIRMGTSALGLGNISTLFPNTNSFQDSWAECEVVVLTKELSSWKGYAGLAFLKNKKQ